MAKLHDGTEGKVLAESNGFQVLQAGKQILVVDRGWGWVSTATFVLGLIAFIFTVAPIVIGIAVGEPLLIVGVGLGLAAAGMIVMIRRSRAKKQEQPVPEKAVLLVLDLGAGEARDGSGKTLCELPDLQIGRRMQATSSSAALQATWPDGKRIIARGNPFGGDVGTIEATLRRFITL